MTQPTILVLVTTAGECDAVLSAASEDHGVTQDYETRYHPYVVHRFDGIAGARVLLAQFQSGPYAPGGILLCSDELIRLCRPDYVILTGTCYGLKETEQELTDIVIVSEARDLDHKKSTIVDQSPADQARGHRIPSAVSLSQAFCGYRPRWTISRVHTGPMLSSGTLVNDPALRDRLKAAHPDAAAGDMECHALAATATRRKTDWIAVRGISDWGMRKDDSQRAQAARAAASFVLRVIAEGLLDRCEAAPGEDPAPRGQTAPRGQAALRGRASSRAEAPLRRDGGHAAAATPDAEAVLRDPDRAGPAGRSGLWREPLGRHRAGRFERRHLLAAAAVATTTIVLVSVLLPGSGLPGFRQGHTGGTGGGQQVPRDPAASPTASAGAAQTPDPSLSTHQVGLGGSPSGPERPPSTTGTAGDSAVWETDTMCPSLGPHDRAGDVKIETPGRGETVGADNGWFRATGSARLRAGEQLWLAFCMPAAHQYGFQPGTPVDVTQAGHWQQTLTTNGSTSGATYDLCAVIVTNTVGQSYRAQVAKQSPDPAGRNLAHNCIPLVYVVHYPD